MGGGHNITGESQNVSEDATEQTEASKCKRPWRRELTEICGRSRVRLDSRDRAISHKQDRFLVKSERLRLLDNSREDQEIRGTPGPEPHWKLSTEH